MNQWLVSRKPHFDKVVEHLKSELSGIRTGRASASLVETVLVEAYGATQELRHLATVTVPDARTVQIEPWDAGVVKDIEKALTLAQLGMAPSVAGRVIRLSVPSLTEETRKEMVKQIGKRVEEARIALRGVREEVKKQIESAEQAGEIAEDARYRLQEELEQLTKEIQGVLDTCGADKERQVTEI